MDRIGVPSSRFANRGVYNICLGPRAKDLALRGPRVVVAIFDMNDWVVRELRQEYFAEDGTVVAAALGEEQGLRSSIIDVDLQGNTTVLHNDAKELFGQGTKWVKVLDAWSRKHGIPQAIPAPSPVLAQVLAPVAARQPEAVAA